MSDLTSPWVRRYAPLIPGGAVLDLACGSGRHSRHLAALGHAVVAVDRDAEALAAAAGPEIITSAIDLEEAGAVWPFGPDRFAGIVVTNYLHRPLMADMLTSLAPNGVLIYETFADGNAQFGKPSNPAFLLQAGELLEWARTHGLRVVAFEDGVIDTPKAAMVQRLCAVKPDFPRVAALLPPF
ncbi:class I SAM-dependent methyltransferase [Duganella violaceipulchra]|uniref:Methyltransferase domain-containing protein n=1 Tax=Duganella violaceipulchra TaxID=2849652 RepID=A0AA41HCB9_9BURK|nr:methyltransferase domain-containing protein [Duganella violaceicalia]MBV6321143.1 methyltransferase domain-containing protein [Duganella violaceicalia]MCP2009612.1 SAM-dependent methyltransferase [Duganella violaceicalia]